MDNKDLLKEISNKLSALLTLNFIQDLSKMTTADGVKLLMRFNINNQDMADILGTTKRTVEVTKSRITNQK